MPNKIYEREFAQGIFQIFDDRPDLSNLIELEQVHGDFITDKPESSQADGIHLKLELLEKYTPAIKTADCLPILYINENEIALVHAGWRGLELGIHIAPKLRDLKFENILIGPSISAKNFEVGSEFRDHFTDESCFSSISDKLTFNLQKYVVNQLRECFPLAIIEEVNICTYDDANFNSFRKNKTPKRNWNIFKNKD